MNACIVSITDSFDFSRTLDRYIHNFMGRRVLTYFMTYGQSLLSSTLVRQTDLFILETLRHDELGFCAEGIRYAEKLLTLGKRTLLISGSGFSDTMNCAIYWDISAMEPLHERIRILLQSPLPPKRELNPVRKVFKRNCRPFISNH